MNDSAFRRASVESSEGDPFFPNTQVIFSSDTIYFNIHINIYEQTNIIIYIYRDALRITKLASDIYDILREYYKSKSERRKRKSGRIRVMLRETRREKQTKRNVTNKKGDEHESATE